MTLLEITLLILLATILAFVSGKIPFAVISSGIILALILTGVMTPAEAFGGFINTNVVMFVAMFVIGAGLTKTVLIDKAQSLVVRYKDNQRVLIFLSCAAAAFLGAITSATATAAIMIPLLVGIANDIGTSRSKLLYPAMACANIATQMTFMGQGASNMAWNDVMMKAGAPNPLHVWDFTVARIPMLATAILYMTFVGYKLMPDIPNGKFSDGASGQTGSEKISPAKQKLAMIIILATIALMLLEKYHRHQNVPDRLPWRSAAGADGRAEREGGAGIHPPADDLLVCGRAGAVRCHPENRRRRCCGGLDDQNLGRYDEYLLDYGCILPCAVCADAGHVEPCHADDFYSSRHICLS